MAASTSKAMSSTQCATTPSLHALHNTPLKLLFVRVALVRKKDRLKGAHAPATAWIRSHALNTAPPRAKVWAALGIVRF